MQFEAYCRKYGKNHDMMAPFVVNEKRNGLMFPEGFWAQHRPEMLTVEDYLAGPLDCQARQPLRQRHSDNVLGRLPLHHP